MKKKIKIIIFVVLAIFALRSLVIGFLGAVDYPLGSFDFQYDSAKLFAMRINPYDETLYPTGVAEKLGLTEFYGEVEANQFVSMLILLVPLTFFPPYAANVLWAILNLFFTILFFCLMKRLFLSRMERLDFACLICFTIGGLSWCTNIGNGQHTIFSFCFFIMALYFSERGHRVWGGIALAFSLFKYTLILPMAIYFVYKKRYKEIAVASGIHIILTIVGAWWIHDSIINVIKKPLEISSRLSSSGFIDFGSTFDISASASMVIAVLACVCLLLLSFLRCGREEHALLLLMIATYTALVIIYHRYYDFFVLCLPLGIIYLYKLVPKGQRFMLGVGTFIFVSTNYASWLSKIITAVIPVLSLDVLLKIYAFTVYIFIVYLVIVYVRMYRESKALEMGDGWSGYDRADEKI